MSICGNINSGFPSHLQTKFWLYKVHSKQRFFYLLKFLAQWATKTPANTFFFLFLQNEKEFQEIFLSVYHFDKTAKYQCVGFLYQLMAVHVTIPHFQQVNRI